MIGYREVCKIDEMEAALLLLVYLYIFLFGRLCFCEGLWNITAKRSSRKWGLSQRRVQVFYEQERVYGAKRLCWAWAILEDTPKLIDARRKRPAGKD
jgi:hypothetical protein